MTASPERPAVAPALLDVGAVAELLNCSVRHVYRLADRGAMPQPVRLGSLLRWRRATGDPMTGLEDWLKAGCPSCRQGGRR